MASRTGRGKAARRGRRLDGAMLDLYTAAWLSKRFLHVAYCEALRTLHIHRRGRRLAFLPRR